MAKPKVRELASRLPAWIGSFWEDGVFRLADLIVGLILCSMIFSPNRLSAQQTATAATAKPQLGFTLIPDFSQHVQTEGARAGIITFSDPPQITILETPYSPTVPVGTTLSMWLRDGRVLFVASRCNSNRYIAADTYVAKDPLVPGSPVTCLTCANHSGHDKLYIYNAGLQPVYKGESNQIMYFVSHTNEGDPVPNASEPCLGPGYKTKVQKLDADGKRLGDILPFDVNVHGCQISPDGKYLTCEALKGEEGARCGEEGGVLLVRPGTHPDTEACIRKNGEAPPAAVGVWSPDSKGFLYLSHSTLTRQPSTPSTYGWLNYYQVPTKDKPEATFRIAQKIQLAAYCNRMPKGSCPEVGKNTGGDAPVWSRDSKSGEWEWVFYSALFTCTGESVPRLVIGKVSLKKPDEFIPVTCDVLPDKTTHPECEIPADATHPAISADGEQLAFLGACSKTNRRSQIFVKNLKSGEWKKLTSFEDISETGAFNPQWSAR